MEGKETDIMQNGNRRYIHSCRNCEHPIMRIVPFDALDMPADQQSISLVQALAKWEHASAAIAAVRPSVEPAPFISVLIPYSKCQIKRCRCRNAEPMIPKKEESP